MTKLCPRGKAAAKRKFAVYPSAYANAYASKICAGKIKDPSGVKRKDFKGPKPAGKAEGGKVNKPKKDFKIGLKFQGDYKGKSLPGKAKEFVKTAAKQAVGTVKKGIKKIKNREKKMGGGMMQMPRAMYGKGGGVCKKGMGRAYGRNS